MCERVVEYFRYQCAHPGPPRRSVRLCPLAEHQSPFGPCDLWTSRRAADEEPRPPTLIPEPCVPCKAAGGWQDYQDLQGRICWRRIQPAVAAAVLPLRNKA
ncbi:hypothetical protein ISF_08406 [Cordyceps fumosorosea ARSEF 2679]|uniref:Uncharacterized protein n=1 Tax=Cordyceps fumosorosea (strain ARSEF 2679) TaxID=1081104 RepID=A0A167MBW7_CORFA|nr:hypothetical protein ISF_08406 [Cordyceps fumosorosea ARSEF 2679]OAA54179.1 hypothetical protein ISF_08406 [Cordyceps fumosorosea ARSEF 2679]